MTIYDNAANMSGLNIGIQVIVKKINPIAIWVPRITHYSNLIR